MLKNCFSIWYKKQNMKDQENVEKFSKKWLLLFFVVFILWAGSAIVIRYVLPFVPEDSESIWSVRGTFGDMFGAVNALFSGLAFAGMIITLILQRKEFALQREELSNSIKALEGQKQELQQQKEVMKMQQKVANIQCFENGFYKLITQHFEIVKTVCYYIQDSSKNEIKYIGQDALYIIALYEGWENNGKEKGYYLRLPVLSSYFVQLYEILRYIDESSLLDEESFLRRINYVRILSSNLSEAEQKIIFLKALYPEHNKFKLLIEKYGFLQNVGVDARAKLYGMSENIERYSDSAFNANQKK